MFPGAFSGWPSGEPRRGRGGGPRSGMAASSLLVGRFANHHARPLLTRLLFGLPLRLRVSRRRTAGGSWAESRGVSCAGHGSVPVTLALPLSTLCPARVPARLFHNLTLFKFHFYKYALSMDP